MGTRIRNHSLLAVLVAVTPMAAGAAPATPEESPRLSDLLHDKNLTGLTYELSDQQHRLRHQARDYVLYKKGRLEAAEAEELEAQCRAEPAQAKNPFCPLILSDGKDDRIKGSGGSGRISRTARRRLIQGVISALRRGVVTFPEELKEATGMDISDALKRFPTLKSLQPLIRKSLTDRDCPSSALLLALGLRVEAELPGDDIKALATLLYQRGQQCGGEYSVQSSYRLGLLQIWDQNWKEAEATLSKIAEASQDPSYRLRIGYWRYYCADQLKNASLKSQLQKWLIREYPLSLHGLLANREPRDAVLSILQSQDPEVHFRSDQIPELNLRTRSVEALLEDDELGLASEILLSNVERVEHGAEVSFQLYWAVLLERAGNRAPAFELLAKIFRFHPQLISKEALEIMYPLREISAVGEMMGAMDPFPVLSAIRQESAFNATARSSAGALGLMQLQIGTARNFERVSKEQLYKPRVNIRVGVKYLRRLLNLFDDDVELALAAYNAGPGRIKAWLKRYPIENRLLFLDLIPLRETRDYVSSIARNYFWYSKLYSKAISEIQSGRKVPLQGPHLLQIASRAPLNGASAEK